MIRAFTAIVVLVSAASQTPTPQQNTIVVFDTEKGTIEMEVDSVHAPATAANFLKYVDAGFYDGGSVNRSVRPDNTVRHDVEIQVIQFQIDSARRREQFPPIPIERTTVTGLRHVDGALSMARSGPGHRDGLFLDRHRRSTGDELWRAPKRRRPGVRGVRPCDPRDGCRESDSGVADGF